MSVERVDHASAIHAGMVHVSWDPRLVALSYLAAVFASSPGLVIGAATAFVSGRLALESRELQEYEQRYSSLFLHNPDAVYSADLRGRITAVNPAAETLTGYPAGVLVGKNGGGLVVPEGREEVARRFALAAGGEAQTYGTAITSGRGARVEIGVTSLPTVVDGEIVGVYGIVKDVTGRKRAEAALVSRNDYLAALHETAVEFMGRSGVDPMLSTIVSRAARLVGAHSGYAFLVEPEAEEMELRAPRGRDGRDAPVLARREAGPGG